MDQLPIDLDRLEHALRAFFQTMKRPGRWTEITNRVGVSIDRPAGAIIHCLMSSHSDQYRLQDLANALAIEAPSATRKTQELEKQGYLRRVPDPKDGRAVTFQLTAAGVKLGKQLRAAQRQYLREALHGWSVQDRQVFITLFEQFSRDLARSDI